jgi:type II secretory pathway pseudopilin PulG
MSPFGLPSAGYPASARWHVFRSRRSAAFTLLEVLVATAVLAMMMTFLFNLLGASTKLWEIGNKKIEAAQAARVGLNIMASDLKDAVSANNTAQISSGNITCVIPFIALGNSTTTAMGMGGGAQNALGSQQMAGVLLTDNPEIPYNEFGYMAVFLNDPNGLEPMIGKRYYLVKQTDSTGSTGGNFYFQGSPDTDWYKNSGSYYPVIENCIRLKFDFYGNQTDSSGPPSWVPNWENSSGPIVDRLPLGVLVTISIVDSRTATKLAALSGNSALSEIDITAGLNAAAGYGAASSLNPIQSLISQGSVTLSRFIPFNTK